MTPQTPIDYQDNYPRRLLKRREAAAILGIAVNTLDAIIKDRELPVLRIRGAVRIQPTDLESYCASRVQGPEA
jgi:excisionase family DNA binding protein